MSSKALGKDVHRLLLRPVAFGLAMMASSMLNNLFATYYLELFSTAAGISSWWFYVGQAVFMVWNAVNDPLFGWLSDMSGLDPSQRRTQVIRWGGPLWCLAFLLTWWPWGSDGSWLVGVHFIVCLCLYDGMLTLVEVNHSALLAEAAASDAERARFNMWSGICAAIGSASSYGAHLYWNPKSLAPFRRYSLVVAFIACAAFELCVQGLEAKPAAKRKPGGSISAQDTQPSNSKKGRNKQQQQQQQQLLGDKEECEAAGLPDEEEEEVAGCTGGPACIDGAVARRIGDRSKQAVGGASAALQPTAASSSSSSSLATEQPAFTRFLGQLCSHRNFVLFVGLSGIQVFDCTFEKSFFAVFLDALAGHGVSTSGRGSVVSLSFLLPHLGTVMLTPLIRRAGLWRAVQTVFQVRIVLLVAAVAVTWFATTASGPSSPEQAHQPIAGDGVLAWFKSLVAQLVLPGPFAVSAFMLLNRVTSELVCRLFPLVLSDLVDEDAFLHSRSLTLSASVVGTAAFASKFSQSLAPMLGYAFLSAALAERLEALGDGARGVQTEDRPFAPRRLHEAGEAGGGLEGGPLAALAAPEAARGATAGLERLAHNAATASTADPVGVSGRLIWIFLLGVPLACVLVQTVLWQRFSLRGEYLVRVKAHRRDRLRAAGNSSPSDGEGEVDPEVGQDEGSVLPPADGEVGSSRRRAVHAPPRS